MSYVLKGLAAFVIIMIFFLIIYFKDVGKYPTRKANVNKTAKAARKMHIFSKNINTECDNYGSKYDEKTGEFYPVLNGDASTATMLVTLPDGSKGWTDGLGNGYIR